LQQRKKQNNQRKRFDLITIFNEKREREREREMRRERQPIGNKILCVLGALSDQSDTISGTY
jgi:hypothetical protein